MVGVSLARVLITLGYPAPLGRRHKLDGRGSLVAVVAQLFAAGHVVRADVSAGGYDPEEAGEQAD